VSNCGFILARFATGDVTDITATPRNSTSPGDGRCESAAPVLAPAQGEDPNARRCQRAERHRLNNHTRSPPLRRVPYVFFGERGDSYCFVSIPTLRFG
jgi:hypothetical protein